MQRIKDIGPIKGPVLVFGGVYSNLQALEALVAIAKQKGTPAENIICTGDVVAYCAQPEECVQTIRAWGIHCIAGNVELQLVNKQDDCGCNFKKGSRCAVFSKNWYAFIQKRLSKESIEWMSDLPEFIRFQYGHQKGFVLHGSYYDTSAFIFKSTDWLTKEKHFLELEVDLILAGHSGIPFVHTNHNFSWINAGVIGMPPNDGVPQGWYFYLNDGKVQFHNFDYNYKEAISLMKKHQLPTEYSTTLQTGIWDNCDVLPVEETKQQGKAINIPPLMLS